MVVQSGVDWMEMNNTLKERGIPLFFPVGVLFYVATRLDQLKDRSTRAPLRLSVACSARGVLEVSSFFLLS